MKYLNVGCGKKYSKEDVWENIDMDSHSKYVTSYNLLKGFPYEDNKFDVVYHSQVLEHIPKENAEEFLKHCYRVLVKGGILRVVVPDLENIINEYQKFLKQNIENPTTESKENYDWIMLELYDQTIRNKSGGLMKEYLEKPTLENEEYLGKRMGFIGTQIRNRKDTVEPTGQKLKRILKEVGPMSFLSKLTTELKNRTLNLLVGDKYKVGNFRLGGEIHYWMYDKYSLGELLKKVGFQEIKLKSPYESDIADWNKYELDVKEDFAFDPTSLFMEAKK